MAKMDEDKIERRIINFKTTGYLTTTNAMVGTFVKAISGSVDINGKRAPGCVGVVSGWHGNIVSVDWDNGDSGGYKISENYIYRGTIEGATSQFANMSYEQAVINPTISPSVNTSPPKDIMTADMVGKYVELMINPSVGIWTTGLEKGGKYFVRAQGTNTFLIRENGMWVSKEYFRFTRGGPISTKPINDENFVNFENAIKSNKNNERDNNDRYKVPRPLTKVGRKQEAGRGTISGARSKARLG